MFMKAMTSGGSGTKGISLSNQTLPNGVSSKTIDGITNIHSVGIYADSVLPKQGVFAYLDGNTLKTSGTTYLAITAISGNEITINNTRSSPYSNAEISVVGS